MRERAYLEVLEKVDQELFKDLQESLKNTN